MPKREFSSWFKRARTLKHRSEETKGFLKTFLNSTAFLSLCLLVNIALPGGPAFPSPETAADIIGLAVAVWLLMRLQSIRRQADRRFLPFARRALMIDRPARVAIRARNPCLRARLRRLGWKVRFITLVLVYFVFRQAPGIQCFDPVDKWPTKEGNCNFFTPYKQDTLCVSLF
jgi:hypothetical protein